MTDLALHNCARGACAPSPAPRAHQPMLACQLEALRAEWRDVQEQITAALDARDLDRAVKLSERCRELDRIVLSQPFSFIQGGWT